YDAAGNRVLMVDEVGSVNYVYDLLSRLTAETRNLVGVGSSSLAYEYNLAGQLKKLSDPTNMTINYNYDRAGRTTEITGENNLYSGVSQYASNLSYRAWGELKGLTYGNNFTSVRTFNARLLPAQFEVDKPAQSGGTTMMKTQYQYYSDGSVKYADNQILDGFDRAFTYDQVSMVKDAYTGG